MVLLQSEKHGQGLKLPLQHHQCVQQSQLVSTRYEASHVLLNRKQRLWNSYAWA